MCVCCVWLAATEVLGLTSPVADGSAAEAVTLDHVKQAYRELARKHHPDKVMSAAIAANSPPASVSALVQRATEVFRWATVFQSVLCTCYA